MKPSSPEKTKDHRQPNLKCDQRNDDCCQSATHARAAVEDGNRNAALLARKPLGYRLTGCRPVKSFADTQQKTEGCEAKDRAGKPRQEIDHRPEDDGQRQAQPCSNSIKEYAAKQPGDRIGNLESTENLGQIGMAQMVLRGDHRGQNRECLAADVIRNRRKKQRPDNPPSYPPDLARFRSQSCRSWFYGRRGFWSIHRVSVLARIVSNLNRYPEFLIILR